MVTSTVNHSRLSKAEAPVPYRRTLVEFVTSISMLYKYCSLRIVEPCVAKGIRSSCILNIQIEQSTGHSSASLSRARCPVWMRGFSAPG